MTSPASSPASSPAAAIQSQSSIEVGEISPPARSSVLQVFNLKKNLKDQQDQGMSSSESPQSQSSNVSEQQEVDLIQQQQLEDNHNSSHTSSNTTSSSSPSSASLQGVVESQEAASASASGAAAVDVASKNDILKESQNQNSVVTKEEVVTTNNNENENENNQDHHQSSPEPQNNNEDEKMEEPSEVLAAAKGKPKMKRAKRQMLPLNRRKMQEEKEANDNNNDVVGGILAVVNKPNPSSSSHGNNPHSSSKVITMNVIMKTPTAEELQAESIVIDDVNDNDILMGSRKCNKHPGNKVYRDIVRKYQPQLETIRDRAIIANMVVDHIHNEIGGRFLKVDSTNQWHVVPRLDVITKITKALVELRNPPIGGPAVPKSVPTSTMLESIGQSIAGQDNIIISSTTTTTKRPKRKSSIKKVKEEQVDDEPMEKKIAKKRKKTESNVDAGGKQKHPPIKKIKRTLYNSNKEQIENQKFEEYTYKDDPNEFYVEETAHIYHNPPFPSELTNGVTIEDLRPVPPPLPLPIFPKTNYCQWSFDEKSRVLIADFTPSEGEDGKQQHQFVMTTEDSKFLFEMYERDDITVISRGLLNLFKVDPSLWSLDYVNRCVGREFYHKFRRFDRVVDEKGMEVYNEMDTLYSMRFEDFVQYCDLRKTYLKERQNNNFKEEPIFSFEDHVGKTHSLGVWTSALYMIDVDIMRLMPLLNENFLESFELSSVLPGGSHCMMNSVTPEARPFMGPNLYVTPPASFTHFHQDGHGTVDSGHLCISGFNEVIMLRRLTERHKRHALWILSGKQPNGSHFDGLYSVPHGDGLGSKPKWPTMDMVEECKRMGYCPSLLTLGPGELIHINKGRLHAFRKMSTTKLPESDCFAEIRRNVIESKGLEGQEKLCISIAWDWMYRGVTSAGINREVCTVLEGSTLNRMNSVKSLAIPELALLQMAKTIPARSSNGAVQNLSFLDDLKKKKKHNSYYESTKDEVCRGIYPGLSIVVGQHIKALNVEECKSTEKGKRLSIAAFPDTQENPSICPLDPYGDSDFECKLCNKELSNVYYHCDGCEKLLSKDFNICQGCHVQGHFMCKVQMHPSNPKRHSTLNHMGDFKYDRESRCPCKNGPACNFCGYCLGCSCRCHSYFTMRTRLCTMSDEERLLQSVKETGESKPTITATDQSQSKGNVFDAELSIKYLHERLKAAGDYDLLSEKDETIVEEEEVKEDEDETESDENGDDENNDDLVF